MRKSKLLASAALLASLLVGTAAHAEKFLRIAMTAADVPPPGGETAAPAVETPGAEKPGEDQQKEPPKN